MNLGGVPPPALYRGYVHAGTRQSRGTPEPPKTGAAEWGVWPQGDAALPAASPLKATPKEHKKTPKYLKINPKWRRLGPESVGGGGGGISPLSQLRFAPSTFVFGVNFWFLAAPSSRPINIYIYIFVSKNGGLGPGGGGHPHPYCPPKKPNRRDSKCSETVFGCHQTCGSQAGARPGHGPRRWG